MRGTVGPMRDSRRNLARGAPKTDNSGDLTVARLAAKQFGVVSIEQLRTLGLTRGDVRGWIKRAQLHPLHKDVFAVGHTRIVSHAHLIAALLTCGPASFLSHRTAAAVWGLREVAVRRIEVTIVGTGAKRRQGLVIHRTENDPDTADLATRTGLRVSSVPRMLVELAQYEKPAELDRLITEAVRKRILDLAAVEAALIRHARRPGVAHLKRALRDYRPRRDRKSQLERDFDRLITGTDIPPPQRNVIIGGWEIDCFWPEARLAVELDGRPYHVAVRDIERDKLKDAKLLRLQIRTMRITDMRFTLDPTGILDDLRSLTRST
jgi:very-short-patch-repair endonuclease